MLGGEAEADLIACESLNDLTPSTCTSRHIKGAGRSSMLLGSAFRASLVEEVKRRCKEYADATSSTQKSQTSKAICGCVMVDGLTICPIHFQPSAAKTKRRTSVSDETKAGYIAQAVGAPECTRTAPGTVSVTVSKDPDDGAKYSSIAAAIAAAPPGAVSVLVYPGSYDEPSLRIGSNTRLVGLTASMPLLKPGRPNQKSKPIICCTDTASPAITCAGSGSLIKNFIFRDMTCALRAPKSAHAEGPRVSFQPSDRRSPPPRSFSREERGTSLNFSKHAREQLSFDWTAAGATCHRLNKSRKRGRSSFEDVVSELAVVKTEMESLRTRMHDESRLWRNDRAVWGSAGASVAQEALSAARREFAVFGAGRGGATAIPGPCMIEVVSGKVEIEDCVWDGRPGVFVTHADAAVRRCTGTGVPGTSLRVVGCGNLNFH